MTNADKFKQVFGLYATELWAKPECEFLEWLNADVQHESCEDTISRQAAIDAMTNTLWHYPSECYKHLNTYEFAKGLAELGLKSVPSAQPEQRWMPLPEPYRSERRTDATKENT